MSDDADGAWMATGIASQLASFCIAEPAIARAGGIALVDASSLVIGAAADTALAADRRVVQAMPQGPEPTLTALRLSPLTGCTSIMAQALARSGWNPTDQAQAGNPVGLQRYVLALVQSGMFALPPQTSRNELNLLRYSNPELMARAIASLLPDVNTTDRNRVARAILQTAHGVFDDGGNHASARATLFVQHALAVDAQRIQVHLHWCQAVMVFDRKTNKGTVTEERQSQFNVDRISFSMRMDTWPSRAPEIARQKITDVESWLKASSR